MIKSWNLSILLMLGGGHSHATTILMDYSDGGGDGLHDTSIHDAGFENAIDGTVSDTRTYAEMPNWDNLGGSATATASRSNLAFSAQGPRNVVMSTGRHPAQSMGHTIRLGTSFRGP